MNGLTNYTDEQLLSLYRSGEYSAAGVLIVRYTPVVLSYADRYSHLGIEKEDLVQEGRIALLAAIRTYREDGGAAFRTYASRCIANGLSKVAAAQLQGRKIPPALYTALDEVEGLSAPASSEPEELIIRQEQQHSRHRRMRSLLSDYELNCLRLFLEGHSYTEIAALLQKSPKSVDNALGRARSKLRLLLCEG